MDLGHLDRRSFLRGAALVTGVGAAGLLLPGTAGAATAPRIYSCAEWGARSPADPLVTLDHKADRILIHHIASANSTDYSLAHAFQVARDDQADHIDNNGWSDTGQHFTVSRGGYRLEGRHGSLDGLKSGTRMIRGAHCPGQNDNAIGIENEGLYSTVEPPAAQWNSLVVFCAYACRQYGIDVAEIKGHRDFYNTECPGERLYAKLPQLRKEVAAALKS
ncbi:peptidoglycan recognition protein family protein [Amycolatopsis sp. H20-H5]|uniref:peptidoglycan recognition protein family protein n=1 Tax=Amycolatopsis sp. H20-H5 TaxID=3046309 RepID=UPI002DBC445C|nr:N-acetylmuramoyl-L-alanine amidase [Amycolatopsis sp. H20-H5]MEC3980038.1 N-acetylmuramoyl-L-alanine amidase [Amycolatopsis sp. H20-H5]